MYEEMVTTSFSFLASGPTYESNVPLGFHLVPELATTMLNENGPRLFVFIPWATDQGTDWTTVQAADGSTPFVEAVADKDGRRVDVFLRPEPPPLWVLRWSLTEGCMYSHLREEDGISMAGPEAAAVAIIEPSGHAPFLLVDPPLTVAPTNRPGWQDEATFFPDDGFSAAWSVRFRRPSFLAAGVTVQEPDAGVDGSVMMRAGTSLGVEIVVTAADLDSARSITSSVTSSLSGP